MVRQHLRQETRVNLKFHTLDVFTETRFGGNPLAVVLDADALTGEQMQTIAREFNLSETVFVLKSDRPSHTAKIRIFTPRTELPFAGHPTVGTAILLAELRSPENAQEQDALVVLEETIGTVRVGVRRRPGEPVFAEFDGPKKPEDLGALGAPDVLAAALSLIPNEIGFENHVPSYMTAGLPYVFVPVRTLEAMAKAAPVLARWEQAFGNHGAVFAYCRETQHNTAHFHARMFAPELGVPEDPATGSAAAAFAGVIHRFDTPPDGTHKKIIEQGFEMGRPSQISLSLHITRGKLETVRIGGSAVRVSEGILTV
jgi:trans-2,3-dihydro-3-hydroxyanthranilate isomerase